MEYLTPNFTKDMLKDYTILFPNMAPLQFAALEEQQEEESQS